MRQRIATIAMLFFAAATVRAQDPVKVSPEHYKVEIDNELVRVLRATRGPHEKAPMHEHPEYLAIYLKDLHQKITLTDGTVQEPNRKAGEVSFSKPVKHAEENLSDQPIEVLVVELKPGAARSGVLWSDALDPVKIDPQHHKVEFENERVRVVRILREPHAKIPMHEHLRYVTVALTDVSSKQTLANGSIVEAHRKAGEVSFNKPLQHAEENLSGQPFEAVLIELK